MDTEAQKRSNLRHQEEILKNLERWQKKPLLQIIYRDYAETIKGYFNKKTDKPIVEIGAGVGNLKNFLQNIIAADLFPNPWIDITFSAYHMPFADASLSNIFMFDVFHHLERPLAFLKEARRVLSDEGRLIMIEPYISLFGFFVYGLFHHEEIGWFKKIDLSEEKPLKTGYYAAQGNPTRLFFGKTTAAFLKGWKIVERKRFSCMSYVLSGGYSKPSLYPTGFYPMIKKLDSILSRVPSIFAARCLIVLEKTAKN